jgi:ADP-glucose pyrophosphorylase
VSYTLQPAVPIGGAYRLIDVPMSNCFNSGISKIYVLTQVRLSLYLISYWSHGKYIFCI